MPVGSQPSRSGRNTQALRELYLPFKRQTEFHKSKAKYRLFGGAAGPGKSKALLWEAIQQAHLVRRVDTLLLRRTYPFADCTISAGCAAFALQKLQRSEAAGDLVQRIDHAVWILPQ
jgi:hypothetical protein